MLGKRAATQPLKEMNISPKANVYISQPGEGFFPQSNYHANPYTAAPKTLHQQVNFDTGAADYGAEEEHS
jgi:hypothetical protein